MKSATGQPCDANIQRSTLFTVISGASPKTKRLAPGRLLLLFLLYGLAELPIAMGQAQPASPSGIPGKPHAATTQGVVNFSDVANAEAMNPPTPQPRKARRNFRVPQRLQNMPVPGPATSKAQALISPGASPSPARAKSVQVQNASQAAASPADLSGASLPSPSASASFLAVPDDGRKTLPATQGAVGPNHLMVTLNSQVSVQTRAGTPITTVTLEGWWSSLNVSNVVDPRIVYDPYRQRWIFVAVGDREVSQGLLLAVSQTSDPTGNWNEYFNSLSNSLSMAPLFADNPQVGFNTNWIVVQANGYDTNFAFFGSSIFAFNKASAYAGAAGIIAHRFDFQDTGDVTDIGISQIPAVTLDPTNQSLYLMKNWAGNYPDPNSTNYFSYLRIFSISGPIGSEVFNTNDNMGAEGPYIVIANNPWESTAPDDVEFLPQLGSTNLIYAGDSQLANLVFRGGTLWTTHTVFLPSGTNTPTHSAIQWWEVTPGGFPLQRGRIEDTNAVMFYAYPSIAVNGNEPNNDALLGYSAFSGSQYPSANYSYHVGSDGPSILRGDTVLKAGEGPYYSLDADSGLNLWGDISATMFDPNNDGDLWTIQEYAGPATNRWGTWWGRVSPPVDLGLTVTDSPRPAVIISNITYTLVVTNQSTNRITSATGITLTDTLSPAVSFVSASTPQGSCSAANGIVTCNLSATAPLSSITVTIIVTPNGVGQVTNRAVVLANGPDATPPSVVTVSTVNTAADLGVSVIDSPDPVLLNSNLTYTIVVTNSGPGVASAVALTNTLPASVTFISANSSQGTNTRSGNVVSYTLGSLGAGSSISASIRVSCPTGGLITNRATALASAPGDYNLSNNSATNITRVNIPPALQSISNRTINEDATDNINFTVSDPETPPASLTVTVDSSNPAVIPASNLVLGGSGTNRTLAITPLATQFGSAAITITVGDPDGGSNKVSWIETVAAVNDPPTLDPLSNVTVNENFNAFPVSLTGISSGAANEPDTLTVTATSSNPALLPNPVVSYASPNATGSLTVNPAAKAFGTVTVTVKVNDNQPSNNIVTRTFTVTINPVNDPPTLNALSPLNLNEDAPQQTVTLNGITTGATNEFDTLVVTATSSDTTVIPAPTVTYTSPNSTGTLKFTPVANAFGTSLITVTVNDGQPNNNTVVQTFLVTVNAVNDPPTLTPLPNITIYQDSPQQTINLTGITTGAPNEFDTLTVTAASSNPTVIPNPVVNYSSPNNSGTLTFTPASNTVGSAAITVIVNDNQPTNNTVTNVFTVTIAPVNHPPTLNPIASFTMNEDGGLQTVGLTGITTGATNELDTLIVTAVSGNPNVIPNPTVTYTSPNSTGTLKFTPVTNSFGISVITVTVNDGQPSNNIVRQMFQVTVNSVNDPPTITPIANLNINEDAPQQTVNLSGITTGAANEFDTLTVTATSGNPALIPDPAVSYASPNSTGTLTFTPVPTKSGTATITVVVNDNQPANNTVTNIFTVTVNPVNDPPTLDPIGSITINEDAGLTTVNLTGITSGATNEPQTLALTPSNSNPALLTNLTISYSSPATNGSLSFRTVTNANGAATISVTVNDGGASNNLVTRTFTVTVLSVNDLPTISTIPDQTVNEDTVISVPFTIGDVETPAANLQLSALSLNEELIASTGVTFGGSGANRTVILHPLTNGFGSASIFLMVTDGVGDSASTFFDYTVNPVNDPPTISFIPNQVTRQDVPVLVSFTVDDAESLASDLIVSVTSSNTVAVPAGNLVLGGSGANRTLNITPAAHAFGSSIITLTVNDGGSSNNIGTRSFLFTINAPPTISAIPDQGIAENSVTASLPFTIGDFETPASSLTLSATSSNPALVPAANITFGGSASNRTVTLRPLTNQFGASLISVTVTDGSGYTATSSFLLTVSFVNQPPTISSIANQTINEDASTGPLAFTVSDPETPASGLLVSAKSSNPFLAPNSTIQLGGSGGNRTIAISPVQNQSGSATITLTVRDASGLPATTSFTLTVNPTNDLPTITSVPNQTINEDTTLGVPFVVADQETAASSLIVSAASSNPTLVPVASIVLGGSGPNRMATITPATNQFGTTTITLTVSDGTTNASTSFTLTVVSVNDLPTISSIANQTVSEDTPTLALGFTVGDVETPAASLIVTASSSNPALTPNSSFTFGGSGSSRTVTILPATNQFGSATITLTVADTDGGTATSTFTLTVNPVNDAPTISAIAAQTINEDTPISVPFTINDVDNPVYALTVTVASSNPTLVPTAKILPDGSGSSRVLNILPATNQSGASTITVTVSDGLLSANSSFVLTVSAVNDSPTLDPIPNLYLKPNPGSITVNLTGITSGAANEAQTLTLSVNNSNPSFFANKAGPSIGSYTSPATNATLTFQPASTSVGTVIITVTVNDGSASFSRSFNVNVKPSGNIDPVATGIAAQIVSEDTSTAALPFTVGDSVTPATLLTVSGASSNPGLVPVGNIVFGGSGSNRTVTVTPAANQVGTATITLSVMDTNYGGTNISFLLTVNPVNDAPALSAFSDLTINENSSTALIPFTVGDTETPATSLTVSGTSSNLALVPTARLVFGGSGTNRVLVISPATNQFGVSLITVTVSDGTNTASRSFLLTVTPVNNPPTISAIANQTVSENTPTSAIAFAVGDVETAAASLTLSAASSNPALVPIGNISFGGSGASRTVTVTPAASRNGTATITVSVNDGTTTASSAFQLTVTSINDPPTLDVIGNVSLNQGAGQQTIALTSISAGPNESQVLAVSAVSSNPALIPNPTISYSSPNGTGSLSFTPVGATNGVATITVTVNDGQSVNNLVSRTFTVTVNAAPVLSDIPDQTVNEDGVAGPIAFTVSDLETAAANLGITFSSSNTGLVPNGNIVLGGSGGSRTLTITPLANQFGFTTVTLNVGDTDGNTTSKSFVLVVNSVNDRPTLDPIANLTIFKDAGQQTVNLTGISSGAANEIQALTMSAISGNPALIPNPAITYTSPNSSGTLAFTSVAGASGTATITVTVLDDGGTLNGGQNSISRNFTVTVTSSLVPTLSVSAAGGNVIISWPAAAVGYVLQSRNNFSNASTWTPVSDTPFQVGNQLYVTNSAVGVSRFYRLIKSSGATGTSVPLSIRLSGGNLLITWPSSAAGALESTGDLASGVWQPVAQSPVSSNGQTTVTLDAGSAPRFFRLRSQ